MQSLMRILLSMELTEKVYSNDELFSSDDASFEANLFREATKELKEKHEGKRGAKVIDPVYIWVGVCNQTVESAKQDASMIHEEINIASCGVLDRFGVPIVDEVDAYCTLLARLQLLAALMIPFKPDGYRYPSAEGYHTAFVVPRSMLTGVVRVMTGGQPVV